VPDAIFDDARLAAIYDALDPDRSDLDHYISMVDEFGARTVLDVGCETGTFACTLAEHGVDLVALDPAAASLDAARRKSGADRVRWVHGDATVLGRVLPDLSVDVAVMTGNVAQVFLTDDDWLATLSAVRGGLRPGGRFVFETRDPSCHAWEQWTKEQTFQRTDVSGVGIVEDWVQVTDVSLPFVTFESPNHFVESGETVVSTSTLRFRNRNELDASLLATGFDVVEVVDAPDRSGKEFVYVAERTD
jgi:SAM-dependent methyltransferase